MKTFLVNGNQNSNINTSEHGTQVASLIFTLNDNSEYNSSICGFQGKINGRFASLFSPGGGMGALKFLAKIKGVRVINCSWFSSSGACTYFLSDQIAINELADSHKVSLVFAAGNGEPANCGKTAYNYPASYDSVLSVSSIGYLDPVGFLRYPNASTSWVNSHYNKRGTDDITSQYNDKVDIVAPGHEMPVLTPTLYNLCGISTAGQLGSSYASPLVSGTLGLMYSIDPCLSPMQAHAIIRNSANPDIYALPINAPYIGKLGAGRLDVFKALQATMRQGTNFQQNVDYTNNQTILERTMILAGNNVNHPTRSVGDVNIKANRHIVYQANIGVELSSGFVVEDKASFEIVIQDSPCY